MALLTRSPASRLPPLRSLTSNRLYRRLALWAAALICVWLVMRQMGPTSSSRRRRELVTGRTSKVKASDEKQRRLGWGQSVSSGLGRDQGAHEVALDAFLVRKGLKSTKNVQSPLADDSASGSAQAALAPTRPDTTDDQPKGLGEGDIPIYATTPRSQRMALFVLWPKTGADLSQSSFLLQSFLASPSSKVAGLVLIIRGTEDECASHRAWIGKQERKVIEVGRGWKESEVVCLSERNYLEMHKDYLCDASRWDCSAQEEVELMDHLVEESQGDADPFEDRFRLLRGLVFHQFVDEKIKWLGWAGHDVILGNVFRQFPWDVAPNFDFVVPSVVAAKQDMPVELSSHLGFFQHRPATASLLLDLPGLRSLAEFLNPRSAALTFSSLSSSLLTSSQTTFLATESSLSPVGQPPTVARAISQLSIFTVFLSPSSYPASITQLVNSHRKRFIHLINARRTPVHLRGTFSEAGVTKEVEVSGEGVGVFEKLEVGERGAWRDRKWVFRIERGGKVHERREPRSWGEERAEMILEWGFDIAENHKTTPHHPPPYPPRRLADSHALAFVPSTTAPSPNESNTQFGFRDEIWDPNEPQIREAAHEGEWWDGREWGVATETTAIGGGERMRAEVRKRGTEAGDA